MAGLASFYGVELSHMARASGHRKMKFADYSLKKRCSGWYRAWEQRSVSSMIRVIMARYLEAPKVTIPSTHPVGVYDLGDEGAG